VFLKQHARIDQLGAAAYMAGETGFLPVEHKDQMVAYSTLASPGETIELTLTVPAPGSYTFICLFPGHHNSMLGILRSRT
jgi:uncharacterized cupredoxin-like copper-binding protein